MYFAGKVALPAKCFPPPDECSFAIHNASLLSDNLVHCSQA